MDVGRLLVESLVCGSPMTGLGGELFVHFMVEGIGSVTQVAGGAVHGGDNCARWRSGLTVMGRWDREGSYRENVTGVLGGIDRLPFAIQSA